MKKNSFLRTLLQLAVVATLGASSAQATTLSMTSPTNGGNTLPAGVTAVGGLVLDVIGTNGVRVVAQLSAASLFVGFYNNGTPAGFNGNPGTIGIQTGLTPALLSQLGGGFAQLAVRVTLFDGDSANGNFDFNDNTLLLNGVSLGNWSAVNTQTTDGTGTTGIGAVHAGFQDNVLDTGFFYNTNAATLASIYSSISGAGGQITYQVNDVDPFDNFYDFTQGVDGGLINVGSAPVVTPSVPDSGSSLALMAIAIGTIGGARRFFKARKA
jgi:hypothetical protein